jgi:branched-chain amino acid transport system permease protein
MTMMDRVRGADGRRVEIVGGMRRRWIALPRPWKWATLLAVLALLYTLPLWKPPVLFTPDVNFPTVLFNVSLFVLVGVGLNVVIGLAGLLDLGYIGFYAVGAYTVAVFGSPQSELNTRYPWLVLIPLAIALAMISGVVLGGPTLRLRGDYLAIVTLGFGEIIRLIAVNSSILGGQRGIRQVPRPPGEKANGRPLFGVLDAKPYYWLVLTIIIIVIIAVGNLERSRVGRSWLAIREDEDAAELMGVPTYRFKLWAFAIGAAIGGLSGALFASKQGFINSNSFLLLTSILFVAAVVLGGSGNLIGVILGAVLVSYLPERFRNFQETRYLVFGLALVVLMIFRPQGLIPSRRRAAEIAEGQEGAMPSVTT